MFSVAVWIVCSQCLGVSRTVDCECEVNKSFKKQLKLINVVFFAFVQIFFGWIRLQMSPLPLVRFVQNRLEMWRSSNSNSTAFELRMFSTDSKFDGCFKCFVVGCEFVEKSLFCDWFHMHREQESPDKSVFFLKFNLSHKLQLLNVQHNFYSVMCYTVPIWTLISVTLRNNILLQSFNQCIMFRLIK